MSVVKTPSGNTVTLKDAKDLTHGDRKKIMHIDDDASRSEQAFGLMDNLLAVAIVDWSFDLIIPSVKRETLDLLSPADYDSIRDAATGLVDAINPKTAEPGEDDSDPKAPTAS
jgi:hypothetical protein